MVYDRDCVGTPLRLIIILTKKKTLLEIQHTNTMMFGKPTLYINVFRKPIIYIINAFSGNQS